MSLFIRGAYYGSKRERESSSPEPREQALRVSRQESRVKSLALCVSEWALSVPQLLSIRYMVSTRITSAEPTVSSLRRAWEFSEEGKEKRRRGKSEGSRATAHRSWSTAYFSIVAAILSC
jgi:hypothetical protein